MKFVALFAGLGGFHLDLSQFGHECALASEVDPELQKLNSLNFGMKPESDIREIETASIPRRDILCAGFPCQPYSKVGRQHGNKYPEFGDLFEHHFEGLRNHIRRPLSLRCQRRRYGLLAGEESL